MDLDQNLSKVPNYKKLFLSLFLLAFFFLAIIVFGIPSVIVREIGVFMIDKDGDMISEDSAFGSIVEGNESPIEDVDEILEDITSLRLLIENYKEGTLDGDYLLQYDMLPYEIGEVTNFNEELGVATVSLFFSQDKDVIGTSKTVVLDCTMENTLFLSDTFNNCVLDNIGTSGLSMRNAVFSCLEKGFAIVFSLSEGTTIKYMFYN